MNSFSEVTNEEVSRHTASTLGSPFRWTLSEDKDEGKDEGRVQTCDILKVTTSKKDQGISGRRGPGEVKGFNSAVGAVA